MYIHWSCPRVCPSAPLCQLHRQDRLTPAPVTCVLIGAPNQISGGQWLQLWQVGSRPEKCSLIFQFTCCCSICCDRTSETAPPPDLAYGSETLFWQGTILPMCNPAREDAILPDAVTILCTNHLTCCGHPGHEDARAEDVHDVPDQSQLQQVWPLNLGIPHNQLHHVAPCRQTASSDGTTRGLRVAISLDRRTNSTLDWQLMGPEVHPALIGGLEQSQSLHRCSSQQRADRAPSTGLKHLESQGLRQGTKPQAEQ